MNNLFMILAAIYIAGIDAQFFYDRKPCKYEDSECYTEVSDCLKKEMLEGVSSWNILQTKNLNDYRFKIKIQHGQGTPFNIELKYTKNLIYGFKDAVVSKVKGFDKDLKQKHEVAIKVKNVGMIAEYSFNGMLLKPVISGTGKSNITFINSGLKMIFSCIPLVKNGGMYMQIANLTVDMIPENLIYNFSNLFKGHIEISDKQNKCRCEIKVQNLVLDTTLKLFRILINDYITSVINNVFQKHPYEKYFAKNY